MDSNNNNNNNNNEDSDNFDDFNSSLSSNYSSDERFQVRSEERRQLRNIIFNEVRQSLIQPPRIPRRRPRRRRRYIERNREDGHQRLYNDYFAPNPVYTDKMFRRRFRMRRPLFLRVVNGVQAANDYFEDGPDATGRDSFTSLQKCTMSIRMLGYGDSADRIDEYLRVGESTARECLQYFTDAVISHFGTEYLRLPTVEDTQRLLQIGASRGFPGMLGSIDCMHWKWKNCPKAWQGHFQGRNSSPTVILEAIASQDLWIWHSYFGTPVVTPPTSPKYLPSDVAPPRPCFADVLCYRLSGKWGYRMLSWDLVGSGKTRRKNNLKEVEGGVVLQSQAVLVGSKKSSTTRKGVWQTTHQILERLEAHVRADDKFTNISNSTTSISDMNLAREVQANRCLEKM
ncbi:hypothetical protein KSS87_009667 [Heliosperma pusillum]|nr:hypothetical protein KSS87_009667 [Heliosperma pusillum]